MRKKAAIRKLILMLSWIVVVIGMTTLLVAAGRRQDGHSCTEVFIVINGSAGKFYLEKTDIAALLERTNGGALIDRAVKAIDLARLERALRSNSWIRNAELYFDSNNALHVVIDEREPVARVFTRRGSTFYIDSAGHQMALTEKMVARVPVITGFPDIRKMNEKDSAFLEEVKTVAVFVFEHPFWSAQVGQIDITAEREFEIMPVIGDHVIRLGSGRNAAEKLDRLYVFYRNVIEKVGFSKYAALDLRFDGQVVAVKKEPVSPVDSIQLQKNIEELMNRASLQEVDETMLPAKIQNTTARLDSTVSSEAANRVLMKTDPNPVASSQSQSNPSRTTTHSIQSSEKAGRRPETLPVRKPKAVMKRQ